MCAKFSQLLSKIANTRQHPNLGLATRKCIHEMLEEDVVIRKRLGASQRRQGFGRLARHCVNVGQDALEVRYLGQGYRSRSMFADNTAVYFLS